MRGQIWWIAYNVNKKERRESSRSTRKSDAVALLRKRQEQFRLNPHIEPRLTVARSVELYIEDMVVRGARTWKLSRYWGRMISEFLGSDVVTEMSMGRIVELQRKLLELGYANASVNGCVSVLRAALRYVQALGYVPFIPRIPRRLPETPRQGFLEAADYQAVRKELEPWAQDVFDFAYFSGWRKSEILTLRWSDVDIPGGVIRLRVEHSKTKKSRPLPIAADLDPVLQRRMKERRLGLKLVFHREGRPVATSTLHREWRGACAAAGRDHLVLHDCRRSAVRDLERAGVPRSVAMAITGHASESVHRRYSIVDESELAGGLEKRHEYLEKRRDPDGPKVVPFEKDREAK